MGLKVVFDLDGTLADVEHRLHHIKREDGKKRDWDAFERECGKDTPIYQNIAVFNALAHYPNTEIAIWTGRNEKWIEETSSWLANHIGFQPALYDLKMRPRNDYTEDHILKLRWLNEARGNGWSPDIAFDDRFRVCEMFRENSVVCHHVAGGFF